MHKRRSDSIVAPGHPFIESLAGAQICFLGEFTILPSFLGSLHVSSASSDGRVRTSVPTAYGLIDTDLSGCSYLLHPVLCASTTVFASRGH